MNRVYTYYHFMFEGMSPSASWWRSAKDPSQFWRRTPPHEVSELSDAADLAAIVMGTKHLMQAPHVVLNHDGTMHFFFWELIPWHRDLWGMDQYETTEAASVGTVCTPGRRVIPVIPR